MASRATAVALAGCRVPLSLVPTRLLSLYLRVPLQRKLRSYNSTTLCVFQRSMEVSNVAPYSKPLHSHCPTIGAPYKTETVGGCEVHHKNLIYGDTTIHFVECGNMDGELVILVHGFPNFWFLWKNQFKALTEAGYRVIAPDLRGYNTSSRPSGFENYGQDQVSCDLLHLVDCCSRNQAVSMVGHDWGGCSVWAFAETHPNKLKEIVIVNSPHFDSFRNLYQKSLQQRLRSWYFVFFQIPVIPEVFLRFNRFWALRRGQEMSSPKGQPEEDIDRYVEAYSSPGALTGMINYYRAARAGYWSKIGRTHVRIPVKVIWGELDRYLDRQLARPPKNLVPDATVLLLPQVSHWPMWDDPELFNQALLKFLS